MLQPRKFKFRKAHRGRMGGLRTKGSRIEFGQYALKAVEAGWVTARQIEAARRAITNYVQRGGNLWIRVFPDKPVSARPLETRMGGGKGAVDHWVAVVRRGRIMYEVAELSREDAFEALRRASRKLSISTKVVERSDSWL